MMDLDRLARRALAKHFPSAARVEAEAMFKEAFTNLQESPELYERRVQDEIVKLHGDTRRQAELIWQSIVNNDDHLFAEGMSINSDGIDWLIVLICVSLGERLAEYFKLLDTILCSEDPTHWRCHEKNQKYVDWERQQGYRNV